MGTMLIETDTATDTFLLQLLGQLSAEGKIALKDGRNGVVKYLISEKMKEQGGN